MGCTRPHLRWASGLVGQESVSERPASARCNNRHSVLPRHGVCPLYTSNIMAAHGSPDGTTPYLLLRLMVVDTCPIRLQQPIVHHRVQRRREQTYSESFLARDRSGYETDQPSPSVLHGRPRSSIASASNGTQPEGSSSSDRKMTSLLQPPPTHMEGPQRMHNKLVSFFQVKFMEDCLD